MALNITCTSTTGRYWVGAGPKLGFTSPAGEAAAAIAALQRCVHESQVGGVGSRVWGSGFGVKGVLSAAPSSVGMG